MARTRPSFEPRSKTVKAVSNAREKQMKYDGKADDKKQLQSDSKSKTLERKKNKKTKINE